MFKFVEGILQLKTFTIFWIVFAQHPIPNWMTRDPFVSTVGKFFCSSELSLLFPVWVRAKLLASESNLAIATDFLSSEFRNKARAVFFGPSDRSSELNKPGPYYKNKLRLSRAYFCKTLNKNFRGSWANLERFDFGLFSLSTQETTWVMGPKRILHSLVVWKTLDLLKLELLILLRIRNNWMDVLPASFFKV